MTVTACIGVMAFCLKIQPVQLGYSERLTTARPRLAFAATTLIGFRECEASGVLREDRPSLTEPIAASKRKREGKKEINEKGCRGRTEGAYDKRRVER